MPTKRGRPLSADNTDEALGARRAAQRERQRQSRLRRLAQDSARIVTVPQQRQGELVVRHLDLIAEQPTPTTTPLGLRVIDIPLAEDLPNAQLSAGALPVDDYCNLYNDTATEAPRLTPPLGAQHLFRNSPSPISPFNVSGNMSSPPSSPRHTDNDQADLDAQLEALWGYPESLPGPRLTNDDSAAGSSDRQVRTNEEDRDYLTFGEDSDNGIIEDDRNENADNEDRRDRPGDRNDMGGQEDRDTGPIEDDMNESVDNEGRWDELGDGNDTGEEDDEIDRDSIVEPQTPHQYVADKLYEQLQGGFHGCTEDDHLAQRLRHANRVGTREHCSLSEAFGGNPLPPVLGSDQMPSDFLRREHLPTPSKWEEMFCGTSLQPDGTRPPPKNICLHAEETLATPADVAFDIDSFLGFSSCLSFARQGIRYQPTALAKQNVATDVHIRSDYFAENEEREQSQPTQIRNIPHFHLGTVEGAPEIAVYVLFPHIAIASEKFISLTTKQHTRWLDKIFHPAVYTYYDAHYAQHLPASYRHAYANSKAHQIEDRRVGGAGYQTQRAISYHLQPEHLADIWNLILETIEDNAGLRDFREPQLFFAAKGTKLQFKTSPTRPTLLDTTENFSAYLERVLDLGLIECERLFVDIGKEVCARSSFLLGDNPNPFDEQAHVYMWKRCCLKKYLEWMYNGSPPRSGQTLYEQNLLYEACNLTSLTPRRSRLFEGGLIYSQFYASVKEVTDATKLYPFANDGLEELALDPSILKAARSKGKGRHRNQHVVERAYIHSKLRAHAALKDSYRKSFGLREEHRIGWSTFRLLQNRLADDDRADTGLTFDECPQYAWPIGTQEYLDFIWHNMNKFATGFEVIRARCKKGVVTWEQTKIMAMFLRCLRFAVGGTLLSRESALWWSYRERTMETGEVKKWIGLGFSNTLPQYGYAWLEPRIDWTELQFQVDVSEYVLFGNNVLRGQYLRHSGEVNAFFNLTKRSDLALEWLQEHREHARICDQLVLWLIHLVFEQFRKDVLTAVQHDMKPDERQTALEATQGWSMEYFEEIMSDGVHLVAGNRSEFKVAKSLVAFLFGFKDGIQRTFWETKPYRVLYQRILTSLTTLTNSRDIRHKFKRRFSGYLLEFHWILPYPTNEVLTQTTKERRRMWYSIVRQEIDKKPSWAWGRKSWQHGRPEPRPAFVDWPKQEWDQWLRRRGPPREH